METGWPVYPLNFKHYSFIDTVIQLEGNQRPSPVRASSNRFIYIYMCIHISIYTPFAESDKNIKSVREREEKGSREARCPYMSVNHSHIEC